MRPLLILLTLALLLGGCGDSIEPGRTQPAETTVRGLATAPVAAGPALTRTALVGTVESLDRAELTARLAGRVERVLVRAGDAVRAGQELVRLDEQTAAAGLTAAAAAVTALGQAVDQARARSALAEQTLQRYDRLRAGQAVTPHEYDQVATARQLAAAQLAEAEARLAQARGEHEAARVLAAQAVVRAPYAARVGAVFAEAGTTVLPGSPLLRLDRSGGWRVRAEVPESLADRLAVGTRVDVEIPALATQLAATVSEFQPVADPHSRSFQAKLSLTGDDGLRAGQFARVLLGETGVSSLSVPASAVVTRGQLTGVYVVSDGRLAYRLVRTGAVHGEQVEILAGLEAGEQVVSSGVERAVHGARLEP